MPGGVVVVVPVVVGGKGQGGIRSIAIEWLFGWLSPGADADLAY